MPNDGSFREHFTEEQLLVKFSGSKQYTRHGWTMWLLWIVGGWI